MAHKLSWEREQVRVIQLPIRSSVPLLCSSAFQIPVDVRTIKTQSIAAALAAAAQLQW